MSAIFQPDIDTQLDEEQSDDTEEEIEDYYTYSEDEGLNCMSFRY